VQIGGNSTNKPGYQFGAQFLKPSFLDRTQTLRRRPQRREAESAAYDQTA